MSPKLTRNKRLQVLRDNLTTNTFKEIAQLCGVTERTILRDVSRWQKNGGYDRFLLREFFELYGVIKLKDPRHAFDRVCDLLRRRQEQFVVTADPNTPIYSIAWVGGVDKTKYSP